MTHKAHNNTAPEYLSDLIRFNYNNKGTNVRTIASFDPCLLCVPPISKMYAFFERSFVYVWNALGLDIRLLPFDDFQEGIMTHLYLKYFVNDSYYLSIHIDT